MHRLWLTLPLIVLCGPTWADFEAIPSNAVIVYVILLLLLGVAAWLNDRKRDGK